jgi:hypothetical protein
MIHRRVLSARSRLAHLGGAVATVRGLSEEQSEPDRSGGSLSGSRTPSVRGGEFDCATLGVVDGPDGDAPGSRPGSAGSDLGAVPVHG